jgi:hypothetical protein
MSFHERDDVAVARLLEFRDWVQIRIEHRQDCPAIWYRYVLLRDAIDGVLVATASAPSIDHATSPQAKRPHLRLVDPGDAPEPI